MTFNIGPPGITQFQEWQSFKLNEESKRRLYVRKGFAHGCQTPTDEVEMSYLRPANTPKAHESGVRHNDPAFYIIRPLPVTGMLEKDKNWPVCGFRPCGQASPRCMPAPDRYCD